MNIYVANLPQDANEEMLYALFSPYGEVEKIRLMVDLQTKINKGYAFVTIPDDNLAENAIQQLNGFTLNNKKIAVRAAGKNPEKQITPVKSAKKTTPKPDLSIFDGIIFKGIIKFYEEEKSFGFILLENRRDLFFHKTALPDDIYQVESGQPVTFNIQYGKNGFVATNIAFE